ncbi:hypothetical protein KSP40_PGU000184 [Platanthera guangdongensis]|uniref:Uncharacterized protein n=1 Tax=Platanthera guangdongensis TaxID=2320717 RepID=A0ABR2LVH3_9ASPA
MVPDPNQQIFPRPGLALVPTPSCWVDDPSPRAAAAAAAAATVSHPVGLRRPSLCHPTTESASSVTDSSPPSPRYPHKRPFLFLAIPPQSILSADTPPSDDCLGERRFVLFGSLPSPLDLPILAADQNPPHPPPSTSPSTRPLIPVTCSYLDVNLDLWQAAGSIREPWWVLEIP